MMISVTENMEGAQTKTPRKIESGAIASSENIPIDKQVPAHKVPAGSALKKYDASRSASTQTGGKLLYPFLPKDVSYSEEWRYESAKWKRVAEKANTQKVVCIYALIDIHNGMNGTICSAFIQ